MGFFQRIGNAMARFMYGRNGVDQLNRALAAAYLILFFGGTLVSGVLKSELLATIFATVENVVMLLLIFRMFSKNLAKRRAENAKFLQLVWWPLKRKFTAVKDREHKYFTCPNCRTVCRVPRGKGKIVITCPKCRGEIHGKS